MKEVVVDSATYRKEIVVPFQPATRLAVTSLWIASLIVVILALNAPSARSAAWIGPVTTLSNEETNNVRLALAADGTVHALWSQGAAMKSVFHASQSPGGAWTSAVQLSGVGVDTWDPRIAVDPDGDVVVVWIQDVGGKDVAYSRSRAAAGGAWSAAIPVTSTLLSSSAVELASAADGTIHAVFRQFDGANGLVRATSLAPGGGAWSAPVTLSDSGQNADLPQIAIDADGNIHAIWYRFNGANFIIQAAVRPAGGAWGADVDVSMAGESGFEPQIAISADGRVHAIWRTFDGANRGVDSSIRSAAGVWSAQQDVTTEGPGDISFPLIGVSSSGDAIAAWTWETAGFRRMMISERPSGGAWSAPEAVSPDGQSAFSPDLVVAPNGVAHLVWYRDNASNAFTQSVSRVGGTWTDMVELSADGGNTTDPIVVVDAIGNAHAAWLRFNGTTDVAQTRRMDAQNPTLTGASVPKLVRKGKSVAMSIVAADNFALAGPPTWNWGDGTPNTTGTSVTHVFKKLGVRTVTVTLTDTAGNVRVRTFSVTVFLPPRNLTAPSVAGTAGVGLQLACLKGTWKGSQPMKFLFRWQRSTPVGWREIPGATNSTYTPVAMDSKRKVRCRVIAKNAYGKLGVPAVARTIP